MAHAPCAALTTQVLEQVACHCVSALASAGAACVAVGRQTRQSQFGACISILAITPLVVSRAVLRHLSELGADFASPKSPNMGLRSMHRLTTTLWVLALFLP